MKQIEHLPAVVLCVTLVLPCLTLRGTLRGVPSCRSFQRARRVVGSSFEVTQGQRHDGEP
jgi:hypothetical protein